MRAAEIADELDCRRQCAAFPTSFANFANADMVGHAMTDAARFDDVVRALLALDEALERVVRAALNANYVVFVTGDHGNAEQMFEGTSRKASPSHTTNKVPFVVLGLADDERAGLALRAHDLTIADIGPAALALRGIVPPPAWDRPSPFVGGHIKPSVQRRVMRLVLDGYGVRDDAHGNAMIAAAQTRADKRPLCVERWLAGADNAVSARAEASGAACGYPAGEAGTTEFGHVLFDAGRSVFSDLMLIDKAIATGAFAKNKALVAVAEAAAAPDGPTLHVMGILSDGKVHSSLEHLDGDSCAVRARTRCPAIACTFTLSPTVATSLVTRRRATSIGSRRRLRVTASASSCRSLAAHGARTATIVGSASRRHFARSAKAPPPFISLNHRCD
jgi:bisphosphoglycerate-independent phosphoglycerate mutase (AlkP superfamily)